MTTQIPTLSWTDEFTADQWARNPYASWPYATWARLRREAPLVHVPLLGAAVATSRTVCQEVAASPDFGAVSTPATGRTIGHPAVTGVNGPVHADLRAMVDPSLQPAEVDRWVNALVRPIAREALDRFIDDGRAELVGQYLERVSIRALGDAMGLYSISSDRLRDWYEALRQSYTNAEVDQDGRFVDRARFEAGDRAKAEIREAVDPLLDTWLGAPEDVWISHWLHDGMPEGQTRDWGYIYPTLYVFLLCGMRQPADAMRATLAGLLGDPSQLAAVVADPKLIPQAVAEGMRWLAADWPATPRIAIADTRVDGFHVPKDTVIIQAYGSANHDESHWAVPLSYDLRRPATPHLAFGFGSHACAGGYFANQVCRIALEELFRALPHLTAPAAAEPGPAGPTELHVAWRV